MSWSEPELWRDAEDVRMATVDPRIEGPGIVLQHEDDPYADWADPFFVVDYDDVRDSETGAVHPTVAEHITAADSYADVSTSGTGVHIIARGALPDDVKQASFEIDDEPWGENEDPPSVEIYDGKKVCAVTGEHVPGTPKTVEQWDDDGLEQVLDEHLDEDDRVDDASHDTDSPDLDGYEPSATSSTEETDDIRDVYAAIDRLDPGDLPLRTSKAGEDATGWEKWDPSTYRSSSSGESLHRAPHENTFYDHKEGQTFGVLGLFAYEQGIITKPWAQLSGSDWWDAVEQAREEGADIPEYESDEPYTATPNSDGWDIPRGEDSLSNVEKCEPPVFEVEDIDPKERWTEFQEERFEDFTSHDRGELWLDDPGLGKTTNAAIGAAKRDESHVVLFDKHEKAREFMRDEATPDDYYHLKGGEQKQSDVCMDADHNDENCPEHGETRHCPSMCPVYDLPTDSDLRETYQAVARELGPVEAHLILDPHDGEQCPWMDQFEEIKRQDRVVGVHEYQMLKTVREKDHIIIDEAPSDLRTERELDVEDLVRMSNTLEKLAKLTSGAVATNSEEFAEFADRLVDALTGSEDTDTERIEDIAPPDFEWSEEMVFEYGGDKRYPSHIEDNHEETFAEVKVRYSETVVNRMRDEEWNGAPVAMDALIAAAVRAGIPPKPAAKAIATPATLDKCPVCKSKTQHEQGRRVCGKCGWDESTGALIQSGTELARAQAEFKGPRLEYQELPLKNTLPDQPLILDATGSPRKAERLYGHDFETSGEESVEANIHLTQVLNGQYHHGSWKQSDYAVEHTQDGLERVCELHDKVLVGGEAKTREYLDLPENADWMHYHASRGLNRSEYDAVALVGAPHPDIGDLQKTAELLAQHSDTRVGGREYSDRRGCDNPPIYRKLLYEDHDGQGRAVSTKHYSGLVGELFRETREREIEQFVHRLRPVLADSTNHGYLLTNIPTDLRVDEVVTFDEFTDGVEAILPLPERGMEFFEVLVETAAGEGPDGFRADTLLDVDDERVEIKKRQAHQLAQVSGLDVSYRTICEWVNELEDCALLEAGEYEQQAGVRYSQDVATLKSALQVISYNDGFKVAVLQRLSGIIEKSTSVFDWLRRCESVVSFSPARCELGGPPD